MKTAEHEGPNALSERACLILKLVVERYIADGHPVGSRTLADLGRLDVSAATIRSTLSDLEQLGFLHSPHTSAGRVPTPQGYRYFVDTLLTPQMPQLGEHETLRHQLLARLQAGEEAAASASQLLSQLSQLAAVVSIPRQNRCQFRHIEFIRLGPRRVLAVLVVNDREVQNRVIDTEEDLSPAQLTMAGNVLNQQYAGRDLLHVREALRREVSDRQQQVNQMMREVADFAEQVLHPGSRESLAVAGRGHLLADEELLDVERLRGLFDALDRKRDILKLLDRCLEASGIRIYIGQEAGYDVLDNCSLVTAPYKVDGEIAGVLGVIGPQRMDYRRIIPLVDATATALGAALKSV